jgi:hypothetical protein
MMSYQQTHSRRYGTLWSNLSAFWCEKDWSDPHDGKQALSDPISTAVSVGLVPTLTLPTDTVPLSLPPMPRPLLNNLKRRKKNVKCFVKALVTFSESEGGEFALVPR